MAGRPQSTGRFKTREDLENFVMFKYRTTLLGDAAIGRMSKVSGATVATITKKHNYK